MSEWNNEYENQEEYVEVQEVSCNIAEPIDVKPKKKGKVFKGILITGAVALASFGGGSLYTSYQWMEKYEAVQAEAEANKEGATPEQNNVVPTAVTGGNGGLSIPEIANKTANSVVEITTEVVATDQFFGQFITQGAGSGVVLTTDGYIVTNNHVIDGAKRITVRLANGEEYPAELVGTDSQTDVAVIKVDGVTLEAASLGDSDSLQVGELAVAIGNPLGQLGGTVTNGIISALDREITISGKTMSLLQTNAAINPGNSGGGLFNQKGELVGLVVAKSAGSDVEGLGFAIPVNKVKEISDSLINNGYVAGRPALGIKIIDINSWQMAMQYNLQQTGVYIAELTEGGSAAADGLKVGDFIVAINDIQITSAGDISNVLADSKVGDRVKVTVSRNNKLVNVRVKLSELKPTTVEKTEAE